VVSLIYDDRRLLETRVRRLASPRIYSQEPRSRTSRIVSNVSIEDSGNNACTVRSKFVMIEYRRDSQRLFTGTAFHRLVQADGGILIASKRVNLLNCDAPLDVIVVLFCFVVVPSFLKDLFTKKMDAGHKRVHARLRRASARA